MATLSISKHLFPKRFGHFDTIDEDQFEACRLTKSLYEFGQQPSSATAEVDDDVDEGIAEKSPSLDSSQNEDDGEDDGFIERMKTIAIRKPDGIRNTYRRKSMLPSLCVLRNDDPKDSWNYDELNDLRLKFMSLLSDSSVSTSSSMIKSESSSDDYEVGL
jgi:hypothetical protein